ncbi:hypothetical protein DC487_15495 [Sphingobacterium corticibacter]|uniref:Uncharacterized protein n=2 Tax=Sphingobacterium corticibacter TaxID=2171749 RepID=A0A2T8HFC6_9SPHI|nr:hypothetical protein DC487_15495 [Sphingobacterium corticibacter]
MLMNKIDLCAKVSICRHRFDVIAKFLSVCLLSDTNQTLINQIRMSKKLKDYSLEELIQKKKKTTGVLLGFAVVMLVASVTLIYLAIKQKNYALIAVACGGVTQIGLLMIQVGNLNKEIKSRVS